MVGENRAIGEACSKVMSESFRITEPIEKKNAKNADWLSMYLERVASAPFGPGPYRMIVHEPKRKPIANPAVPPIIAPILSLSTVEGP